MHPLVIWVFFIHSQFHEPVYRRVSMWSEESGNQTPTISSVVLRISNPYDSKISANHHQELMVGLSSLPDL
jgi:hypothetical protein